MSSSKAVAAANRLFMGTSGKVNGLSAGLDARNPKIVPAGCRALEDDLKDGANVGGRGILPKEHKTDDTLRQPAGATRLLPLRGCQERIAPAVLYC
jgi:hypothetical protein